MEPDEWPMSAEAYARLKARLNDDIAEGRSDLRGLSNPPNHEPWGRRSDDDEGYV